MSVSGLMKSSRRRMVRPLTSLTGTTDLSNQPESRAWAARFWLSIAKASTSSRDQPSMVAIRSAPMPWGTNPVWMLVSGSSANGPPSAPMGTRDMDS